MSLCETAMDIDSAIQKLNEFKKISKKFKGECELVGFNDNSFTFKVEFGKNEQERRPIGFSCS